MKDGVITSNDFGNDKAYVPKGNWKKTSIIPAFVEKPIEIVIENPEDLAYKYAMTSVMIQNGRGGYFADKDQEKIYAIQKLIEEHKSIKEELFTLKAKEQQYIKDFDGYPRWKKKFVRKIFRILGIRHVRYDE